MYKKILIVIILLNVAFFWGVYQSPKLPANNFFSPQYCINSISLALNGQHSSMETLQKLWVVIAVAVLIAFCWALGAWIVELYQRRNARFTLRKMRGKLTLSGVSSTWCFLLDNNLKSFPPRSRSRSELVACLKELDIQMRYLVFVLIDAHHDFEKKDWASLQVCEHNMDMGIEVLHQKNEALKELPKSFDRKWEEALRRNNMLKHTLCLLKSFQVSLEQKLPQDSMSLFREAFTEVGKIEYQVTNDLAARVQNSRECPHAVCEMISNYEDCLLDIINELGKAWTDYAFLLTDSATNLDAALSMLHMCSQILNERKQHAPSSIGKAWIDSGLEQFTQMQARLKNVSASKRRIVSVVAKAAYARQLNKIIMESIEAAQEHVTAGLHYVEE